MPENNIDLSIYCCQNSDCEDFGVRKKGKLAVHSRQRRNPILRCKRCRKTFSTTRGTVYFYSHKSRDEVESILEHVAEGVGVRATARLLHIRPNTVTRYARLGGRQARALHDELVRNVDLREVQLDEKWSYVQKNKAT